MLMRDALSHYQCHKQVRAAKIQAIELEEDRSAKIAIGDGKTIYTTPNFPFKGSEEDLGYFVLYDDDHQSWSPTAPFEAGYALLEV